MGEHPPGWYLQRVLPGEPARNMNHLARALNTLTYVFFAPPALMAPV